jgi:hypothetical protein
MLGRLMAARQDDGHISAVWLDELAVKPKPVAPGKDDDRSWPRATQCELTVYVRHSRSGSGPSPRWRTSTPVTGVLWRSATRPRMVRSSLISIAGNSDGFEVMVIQSPRITSFSGGRITTRAVAPTTSVDGVRNVPSASVRTGPFAKSTGLGAS